jgi:acid phosphatase
MRSRLVCALVIAGCSSGSSRQDGNTGPASLDAVTNIVVIYAENRGFDNIYGTFPGANGLPANGAYVPQLDRDFAPLTTLPQTWGGVTAAGFTPAITQAMSGGLPNAAYALPDVYTGFDNTYITRDLYHRFFESQMQIHGGRNDMFVAYADSGGLVMGHYDGSTMAMWKLAQQYTLADNFFMGAFGGSFLNHQYLICACAPEYAGADTDPAKPRLAVVDTDENLLPALRLASTTPASALDGAPIFVESANIAPKNYFGDGTFRAVNTMQPPYQPSGNAPAATDTTRLLADHTLPNTLPPQTDPTIGDRLDDESVSWAWYSGAWTSTLATATGDRQFPPTTIPGSAPNFEFHHQPFNYYAAFDPEARADARATHFKDYEDLIADAAAGTLPAVAFYKPEGDLDQHAGYASIDAGDRHIAELVAKLQASPQYEHMVIIVTYDENGGWWDHVGPPRGDLLGPGIRIPAIVISPFAKRGFVDHTQYDTGSIQRLLNKRFGLVPLPGIIARDNALATSGAAPMGDLTNALDF